jgi:hypothetical protein
MDSSLLVNNISYGKFTGVNNILKAGINDGYEPADMKTCKQLQFNSQTSFINGIVNSDTYIYGYQNNNYYGCKAGTAFMESNNYPSKNIVWKKSIYSFPHIDKGYIYTQEQSKGICDIYGLKQCSSEEIKYRQQCACGWVSDKNNPVLWVNQTKGCITKGILQPDTINICNGIQKANTYCCGKELPLSYSICPEKYPYPVSSIKGTPIRGGIYGGDNYFCCNTDGGIKGNCKGNNISNAFDNNDLIACAKPPCTLYNGNAFQLNKQPLTQSSVNSKTDTQGNVNNKDGIWKRLDKWEQVEEFTNYSTNNIIVILISILLCICVIIGISKNFKF